MIDSYVDTIGPSTVGVAATHNTITLTPGLTGAGTTISNDGLDANPFLNIQTKGTGAINFLTNSGTSTDFVVTSNSSADVNYILVNGNATTGAPEIRSTGADTNIAMAISTKGNGSVIFYSHNFTNIEFQIFQDSANDVNYLAVGGNSAGNVPVLESLGSDTNIGMLLATKGNGNFIFNSNAGTAACFAILGTVSANAANYVLVEPNDTNNPPVITSFGTDTNVDLNIQCKGSGNVQFGNSSHFSANSNVATALTSVGPSGSHTTVQEWLTIKNASGVVRYIPCF